MKQYPSRTTQTILLIEDDAGLVMTLTDLLAQEGFRVLTAGSGPDGLERGLRDNCDLIILDLMLPGKSGFDVCRDLRQAGSTVPIIMLTARGQLIDKLLGLKLGADDYLCKPFEPLELLARIEAMLRRGKPRVESEELVEAFQFGSVEVDFRSTAVLRDGKQVELSAREFELLRYFIKRRGATVSRESLLKDVWGYDMGVQTRTVDVHVGLLRQKLEKDAKNPGHFLTMRGHGYKFMP